MGQRIRQAWTMQLKPGCAAEYKRRHDEIWPELVTQIRAEGIHDFTIWRNGLTLFASLQRDTDPGTSATPTDLTRHWWQSMAHLMETESDGSPVQEPLEEMFHLD